MSRLNYSLDKRLSLEGLSPRQVEAATGAIKGLKDREIAGVMGTAYRTVQGHLAEAYKRIGVSNRWALKLWAETGEVR